MLTWMGSIPHTQDLSSFLAQLPRGGVAELAARLRVSRVYLSQLAARQGGREPSPELCVVIERETGCRVRRWAMRPRDWHLIWPELIGAVGAPPAHASQNQEARDPPAGMPMLPVSPLASQDAGGASAS